MSGVQIIVLGQAAVPWTGGRPITACEMAMQRRVIARERPVMLRCPSQMESAAESLLGTGKTAGGTLGILCCGCCCCGCC